MLIVNESAGRWFSALIKFQVRDCPVTSIVVYPQSFNLVWGALQTGGGFTKLPWSPSWFYYVV